MVRMFRLLALSFCKKNGLINFRVVVFTLWPSFLRQLNLFFTFHSAHLVLLSCKATLDF